jgi:DNA-binding NtrC family response regulator
MGQAQPNRRLALVVEDDTDLRWLMTSLFEETEFEVIGMKSAEVALATMLLRGRDVGIIFADIQLFRPAVWKVYPPCLCNRHSVSR